MSLIVICVQGCQIHNMRESSSPRASTSNVESYPYNSNTNSSLGKPKANENYISAYDNVAMTTEDETGFHNNDEQNQL